MTRKKTLPEVIAEFQSVHGGRYDYSRVEYRSNKTKVTIGCYVHGFFEQTPVSHKRGSGCPECANSAKSAYKKKTQSEVIADFQAVHGDRYDYSEVDYIDSSTKVVIVCPEHGDFDCTPNNHKRGRGCPQCSSTARRAQHEVIASFQAKWGDRHDYSRVDYVNNCTKVIIGCPEHGDFERRPSDYMAGHGCQKCSTRNRGEGIVYLIEITKPGGESFIKIGWTARGVEERFRYDDFTVTLLDFATFENAPAGEAFEKSMHTALSRHKYIPTEKFGGWTECFDINAKDDIIREFNLAIEQN